jgi:plastocyanin
MMKYVLGTGAALLALAVAIGVLRPGIEAATETVGLTDSTFEPANLTINAGDTVMWEWNSALPHSVTADDGSFDSGTLTGDTNTFTQTLNTPGTYAYFCVVHGAPGGQGMAGTIVVQQGADTPTATNTTGATNTPESTAEPTDTPEATNTPEPTFTTQTTPTAPPVLDAIPISATEPAGGAAALPSSGAGASGRDGRWLALALGAAGATLVAAAGVARLARRRA